MAIPHDRTLPQSGSNRPLRPMTNFFVDLLETARNAAASQQKTSGRRSRPKCTPTTLDKYFNKIPSDENTSTFIRSRKSQVASSSEHQGYEIGKSSCTILVPASSDFDFTSSPTEILSEKGFSGDDHAEMAQQDDIQNESHGVLALLCPKPNIILASQPSSEAF
jgi:hypothetical protein